MRSVFNSKVIKEFKSCLETKGEDMFKYVKEKNCYGRYGSEMLWDVRCKMIPKFMKCFYYVTCIKMPRRYDWNPFCCDPVCQSINQ